MATKNQTRLVATGDAETDPFEYGLDLKPFIFDIFNGVEHFTFSTAAEMVEFLSDKRWIVYFHNGGKFDFHFFIEFIEDESEIMMIGGRIAKFKIGECEFRDSYLIIPTALKNYRKKEIDYDKMKRNVRHLHMKEITDYLHSDTEYLHELVTAFIGDYGRGLTLAGTAFKIFNKDFNDEGNIKTDFEFYDLFSDFYYGGRVECFKKGIIDHPFKMVDINSAYPRAMLQRHAYGKTHSTSDKLPDSRDKIEKAFIHFRGKSHGALPYRNKETMSLEFPNDNKTRDFFVTGWEYLAGIDTNSIEVEKIITVYTFYSYICFDKYVNHFYSMKENSEKGSVEYIFSKILLNALYGKYAANPSRYTKSYIYSDIIKGAEKGLEVSGRVGKRHLMERELFDYEKTYYNVATAASITGWVRAYLFRALKSVKNPIYCDTDSIICEDASKLEFGKKIGQWGIDGEFKRGGIGGKKIYALEYEIPIVKDGKKITHKTACKGARLSASEILRVCQGETVTYKNPVPNFSFKISKKYVDRKIRMT